MNNMNQYKAQYKRERIRESGETQTQGYVSSTQLYVPAFTQKDFHYIVHTRFPTQGTPLRIWVIQTGSTQLLSPTKHNLYARGEAQQLSPIHLEGWVLSHTTITSH